MYKALIFDIETAPITAHVWGLRDQNIGLNQITKDWDVMAWGAKWLGTPAASVKYMDRRNDRNDKRILQGMWKLLDEADIVITQNGQSFDSKKLNARFIMYGMNPPSPYKHLDTYLIVKRVADFTSNKLEYLTDKLCTKYKKLSHSKFPGMSLWNECIKGNKAAWDEMKRYNIHDVLSTEEFYGKIRAWTPALMPKPFEIPGDVNTCGTCGKDMLIKCGWSYTKTTKTQRLKCGACGTWAMGKREKLSV